MNENTPKNDETVLEQATEQAKEAVKELSADELAVLALATKRMTEGGYTDRLTGLPKLGKVKTPKYWYKGQLITKEEHDKLSWGEVFENNNVIRRAKNG
jgi:magnesium-transporting ATPase (P-type)